MPSRRRLLHDWERRLAALLPAARLTRARGLALLALGLLLDRRLIGPAPFAPAAAASTGPAGATARCCGSAAPGWPSASTTGCPPYSRSAPPPPAGPSSGSAKLSGREPLLGDPTPSLLGDPEYGRGGSAETDLQSDRAESE